MSQPIATVVADHGSHDGHGDDQADVKVPAAGRTGEKSGHEHGRLARHRNARVLQEHAQEEHRVAVLGIALREILKPIVHVGATVAVGRPRGKAADGLHCDAWGLESQGSNAAEAVRFSDTPAAGQAATPCR